MRRVAVTGLGAVTSLGCGVETIWSRLLEARSGIRTLEGFRTDDLATKIGGQVLEGDGSDGTFNPDAWVSSKDRRRMDQFIVYGMAAAEQAVQHAAWTPDDEESLCRTGVLIGSGIGGLDTIARTALELEEKGPRRVSPFFIPSALINLVSGQLSIRHGFKGPNHSVVTACSTGAHAIGDASRLIMLGDADVMIAGGAEAAICRIGVAGFNAAKALSTDFNDTPERASRPWDKDRDGFVMGDGAGVVVLEEWEHAKARGIPILAEVVGYGLSGDAHHITAPAPDGNGAFRCMTMALKSAGLNPEDVDYVNAHGTSTPLGDELELGAIRRVFGSAIETMSMSSTKSAIGHLLGAAGAVEAIFSILAMRDSIVPPTLNLDNPSDGCVNVDLVPHRAKERQVRAVLSNSFGFGGTNASVVFKAPS